MKLLGEKVRGDHVLLLDVVGDSALALNGEHLGTAFEEDGETAFTLIEQLGRALAHTLGIPFYKCEVELEDDDWEDWSMTDAITFALDTGER